MICTFPFDTVRRALPDGDARLLHRGDLNDG